MRWLVVALLTLGCRGADMSARSADAQDAVAARQFAQAFYDWYVPLGDRLPASQLDSVVARGAQWFTPSLRQAVQRDVEAQRHATEIVSVVGDFDPFLNSQDPCPRYEAGEVVHRGAGWQVAISARCAGGAPTVVVLADVERDSGTWHFANFRIPDQPDYDLASQLLTAEAQRDSARQRESVSLAVIVLQRDVPVVDVGAPPERRGVLYGDTALVLPRGTELSMLRIGLEGGCTVRSGTLTLTLSSCPWLDGFRDHQPDVFHVRAAPQRAPRD